MREKKNTKRMDFVANKSEEIEPHNKKYLGEVRRNTEEYRVLMIGNKYE